ncbi:hypothetical protein ZWY2020_021347 [Hordeum vulgare]|nr:hypothetical protein ZWY2020_021347 [Hordeum vulgare]
MDNPAPTIAKNASLRAAARDLPSGTSSLDPAPSCSGSRFAILGSVTLGHLGDVASDCDIVFCGEKDPGLEQIPAICAKDRLDGGLAEACARAKLWAQDETIPFAPEFWWPSGNPSSGDSRHRD